MIKYLKGLSGAEIFVIVLIAGMTAVTFVFWDSVSASIEHRRQCFPKREILRLIDERNTLCSKEIDGVAGKHSQEFLKKLSEMLKSPEIRPFNDKLNETLK